MMEHFAEVILPLSVKGVFTYIIPGELYEKIKPGSRVIVQFGKRKLYSGIVYSIDQQKRETDSCKTITDVADTDPLVNEFQLKLWDWISGYYMCSIGEVMKAALPAGLRLESETLIKINPGFSDLKSLDLPSLHLYNIIENKATVYLSDLPPVISNRNTLRMVSDLISQDVVLTAQAMEEKLKPKKETFVILSTKHTESELNNILDTLFKAPRQYELLSAYLDMTGYQGGTTLYPVKKEDLLKKAGVSSSSLASLENKGILNSFQKEASVVNPDVSLKEPVRELTEQQAASLQSIIDQFKNKDTVLLAGVTSSGKTEIYLHLIEQELKKGKQVLYLLPEIAITTQIISRIERHFGTEAVVYHSRISEADKVGIWRKMAQDKASGGSMLIVGVRSALFLPFRDLGLIIVDEEHDGSYKQQDPAPRYNARDSAIVLAGLHKSKILLGTATPSIESFHNCMNGKFGLVKLTERFGNVKLPDIVIANTREAYRKKRMVSHFTPELVNAVETALGNSKQVILFQNRRGFSPYIECQECGWIPECHQCAVKLTYHKVRGKLICHYCGYNVSLPKKCPECGSTDIATRGFGTEKIEDEVKLVFPQARVARLDHDTTNNRNSLNRIIRQFEEHQIDILVGTQMISKGLDFENLTVVGILNADNMLNFPDFRAWEKSFQLLEQVSGRAGRRQEAGLVVIQTSDPLNSIIQMVLRHDYINMYKSQSEERQLFGYPPYTRLIRINMRHREWESLNEYSGLLVSFLKESLGKRVLGPEAPVITRIHSMHIKTILIKIEKEKSLSAARKIILRSIEKIEKMKGACSLKISIDVDPY
jgi:primosomal protein N' (replication factor Y) (superfamily II helicase)